MYFSVKAMHVMMAIISVGAMTVLPLLAWVAAIQQSSIPDRLVQLMDKQISMGGMILVATGLWLVHLSGWNMVQLSWLMASMALIIIGLLWDRLYRPDSVLQKTMFRLLGARNAAVIHPMIKCGLFLAVAALMILKPN